MSDRSHSVGIHNSPGYSESMLLFLFSMLTIKFLTTSISSGLLAAVNNVMLARASLLMIGDPSSAIRVPFCSRNRRKHAAAILLLPSVNA